MWNARPVHSKTFVDELGNEIWKKYFSNFGQELGNMGWRNGRKLWYFGQNYQICNLFRFLPSFLWDEVQKIFSSRFVLTSFYIHYEITRFKKMICTFYQWEKVKCKLTYDYLAYRPFTDLDCGRSSQRASSSNAGRNESASPCENATKLGNSRCIK